MPNNAPRILLWDIETTHNLAAVFQLRNNDYISAENIVQERIVVCAAWKELGKGKVQAVSVLDSPKKAASNGPTWEPEWVSYGSGGLLDDKYVCQKLHEVLSSADVLIAHNGDEYDIKFVKGRMLIHGLPPLPPILSIDTLKTARKQFLLNANNLDYLGKLLGVGGKKSTPKGLWLKVLQGDRKAIKQMVDYNKEDVRLLERVFLKLRPFIPDHINRQLFTQGTGCPRCGSTQIQSRGVHRAATQTYKRFHCQSCKGWYRDRQATRGTHTSSRVL